MQFTTQHLLKLAAKMCPLVANDANTELAHGSASDFMVPRQEVTSFIAITFSGQQRPDEGNLFPGRAVATLLTPEAPTEGVLCFF